MTIQRKKIYLTELRGKPGHQLSRSNCNMNPLSSKCVISNQVSQSSYASLIIYEKLQVCNVHTAQPTNLGVPRALEILEFI